MHDPMTQIWSTRFFILWHVDPETDGSDDSCGWHSPKLTKKQRQSIDYIAHDEAEYPWFATLEAKTVDSPTEAETLLAGAFWLVARVMRVNVSHQECRNWAMEGLHNSIDNFRSSLCFRAGYHSNSAKDTIHDREYHAQQFFYALGRWILRVRRPWYRQTKWHVRHWSLQIHAVENFKRWAWSRCDICGKGFGWGHSVIGGWSSEGPQWFRSERGVHHMNCDRPLMDAGIAVQAGKNESPKLS